MKALPLAILSGLFCGVLGTLAAIWAVIVLLRGEVLTSIVAMAIAVFCLAFIVPFFKIVPGRVTPRSDVDGVGTTIRPDRGIDVPTQVSLAGLVVASGLFALFAPLGWLDMPLPTEMRFYLPFAAGIAAVTTAPNLIRILRRGCTKYLRLTPGGFEVVQGWQAHRGEWQDVTDVTDGSPSQSASTPSAVVLVRSDGSAPTFAAGSCTPDGRALREWVRYYWQNPDKRDELADGRAIQRLTDYQA